MSRTNSLPLFSTCYAFIKGNHLSSVPRALIRGSNVLMTLALLPRPRWRSTWSNGRTRWLRSRTLPTTRRTPCSHRRPASRATSRCNCVSDRETARRTHKCRTDQDPSGRAALGGGRYWYRQDGRYEWPRLHARFPLLDGTLADASCPGVGAKIASGGPDLVSRLLKNRAVIRFRHQYSPCSVRWSRL